MGLVKFRKFILGAIIVLGLFLRVINLNISPPGFNADEAALGYNAYSILKTGKDEWGETFPIVFKSFSDYKPGLYVYLDIPFVAVFGLNEPAVRLPSILLGTLTIWLVYLLSKEFFNNEMVALSSAFLLAISPWHLHFSRGAWETNVATFFITLGVLSFLRGLNKRNWLAISAASLIASIYTYQSPRVVVSLFVLLVLVQFRKKIINKRNWMVGLLSIVLITPLTLVVFTKQGLTRFEGLSIFNDPGPGLRVNVDRGEHGNTKTPSALIYHNKIVAYGTSFLSHYLDHFSPGFLFISGDPLGRNKVPEMGQMYVFELVTLLVGFYLLISKRIPNKSIIFLWLLVAPTASALTYQTPHALRAENMVIPLILISGLGLSAIAELTNRQKKILKFSSVILGTFIILYFIARYFDLYYTHLPKEYALEWEYGFSQMMDYIKQSDSQKIRITDRYDQPYILVLFYSQYDPILYQNGFKKSEKTKYGFSTITAFDKFKFGSIGKEEVKNSRKTLFVGTDQEIGNDIVPLRTVNYPNGEVAFKIVEAP